MKEEVRAMWWVLLLTFCGLFAAFIDHSKLHAAFLNVHDIPCGIALREDSFLSSKLFNLSSDAG